MIIIYLQSVYYVFCIIGILCGTSYKIGYGFGKNARK